MDRWCVVSWNMRRATSSSVSWDYLRELDPDIALLQEVSDFPDSVSRDYAIRFLKATGKSGKSQRFGTAILVRGEFIGEFELRSTVDWVEAELRRFSGNLITGRVRLDGVGELLLVSVYNPAWHLSRKTLDGLDTTPVRLKHNPDVWLADILWHCLLTASPTRSLPLVVGGDFNLSETFDSWSKAPRGNREYLDRMADLGLIECLRDWNDQLVPTFRNPRGGHLMHQIDHLFVSPDLRSGLDSCTVGTDRVLDEGISDHLPIVAQFVLS